LYQFLKESIVALDKAKASFYGQTPVFCRGIGVHTWDMAVGLQNKPLGRDWKCLTEKKNGFVGENRILFRQMRIVPLPCTGEQPLCFF